MLTFDPKLFTATELKAAKEVWEAAMFHLQYGDVLIASNLIEFLNSLQDQALKRKNSIIS